MDEDNFELNATRQALEAIGSPYGGFPKTPKLDISPRVGFAYDLTGDGRRVLRGGYGLYFDQYNTAAAAGDITAQARRPLNALATLTNTAIGVGQLATYRFGIDPLPPQPTEGNRLPLGVAGPVDRRRTWSIREPTRRISATRTSWRRTRRSPSTTRTSRGATKSARRTSIRSSTAGACWPTISSGCLAPPTTSPT